MVQGLLPVGTSELTGSPSVHWVSGKTQTAWRKIVAHATGMAIEPTIHQQASAALSFG